MSIDNVAVSDGAVLKQIEMNQTLEFPFYGSANHPHEAASGSSLLDLFLGESFIILANSLDWGREGKLHIIDKDIGGIRVLTKIDGMKTFHGGFELHHPRFSENFEDPTMIRTVIDDLELLAELVEGAKIHDAPGVKVNQRVAKICLFGGLQCALVAVDMDRVGGWMNIIDVLRFGKEMNSILAIEKDKVRTDETTSWWGGSLSQENAVVRRSERFTNLSKDKNALVLTGD